MELREGQFWKRGLTGYIWQVEAINPSGTVAIVMWSSEPPQRELLTREDFLKKFAPL